MTVFDIHKNTYGKQWLSNTRYLFLFLSQQSGSKEINMGNKQRVIGGTFKRNLNSYWAFTTGFSSIRSSKQVNRVSKFGSKNLELFPMSHEVIWGMGHAQYMPMFSSESEGDRDTRLPSITSVLESLHNCDFICTNEFQVSFISVDFDFYTNINVTLSQSHCSRESSWQ